MSTNNEPIIKPYTNKDLAALYGVSPRIISSWLKLHQFFIGPKTGRYFNSRQVKIIFDRLGYP